jgi:hypothetical protein
MQHPLKPKKIKVLLLSHDRLIVEGWMNALCSATDMELMQPPRRLKGRMPPKYFSAAGIIVIDEASLEGEDACPWLLNAKHHNRTKLVAVVSSLHDIKHVRKLGVDEAILSPFRSQQLIGLIRGLSRDDKSLCMYYARCLERLPQGNKHFDDYLDLMSNILQLVFDGVLTHPQILRTRLKGTPLAHISFDNHFDHAFWKELNTRYILFSVHNDPQLLAEQVRSLGRSLARQGTNLGFLNNRTSPEASATFLQTTAYKNDGMLIVMLFDSDIRSLLALKAAGVEPSEWIERLHQELIGAISDAEK